MDPAPLLITEVSKAENEKVDEDEVSGEATALALAATLTHPDTTACPTSSKHFNWITVRVTSLLLHVVAFPYVVVFTFMSLRSLSSRGIFSMVMPTVMHQECLLAIPSVGLRALSETKRMCTMVRLCY